MPMAEKWKAANPEGSTIAHRISGKSHPVNAVRSESLKQELVRWEAEKQNALHQSSRIESWWKSRIKIGSSEAQK